MDGGYWEFLRLVGVAVISGGLSYWLAVKQHAQQRWWDARHEAYKQILEPIWLQLAWIKEEYRDARANRDEQSERAKAANQRAALGHREILRAAHVGAFLLPPEAIRLLEAYTAEVEKEETISWFKYLAAEEAAAKRCLDALIAQGKADLGASQPNWRRGFRRLAIVCYAVTSVFVAIGAASDIKGELDPSLLVHPHDKIEPRNPDPSSRRSVYLGTSPEDLEWSQLTESARRKRISTWQLESDRWEAELVPRWRTSAYWKNWGSVVAFVAGWTVLFGACALLVSWIVNGFRSGSAGEG
jgi:hypothetical protein